MPLSRHKVILEDHNSKWVNEFCLEKKLLEKKLFLQGDQIQHVGSTAIRGIPAKPVIDILVGVESLDDVEIWRNKLEDAGYVMRPNACTEQRKFFAKGSDDARTHYVHLVEYDGDQWKQLTRFRDYMNANPDKAKQYCNLKRKLARKYPNNRRSYRSGKEKFISKILRQVL